MLYTFDLFRQLMLIIDYNTKMNYLDRNYNQFYSHYQNILIVKELQNFVLMRCI